MLFCFPKDETQFYLHQKKKKKKKIQPNKDIKSKSKTSPILFGGQAK